VRLTQSKISSNSQYLNLLAASLQQHMKQYGYVSVETPIIEAADLFLTRAGDQIIQRLFTFEQYGQQLALRPEFTAAAAYHYAQQYDDGNIVRWQFSGYIFENEPNNVSRNYQRFSVGAELIGLAGAMADAEVISMAAQGITAQGIQNCQIVTGHVGLVRRLLSRFELDSRTERFLLSHAHVFRELPLGKDYLLGQVDKLLIGSQFNETGREADVSAEVNTQQLLDALLDATQSGITMGGRTRHDIARRLIQKRKRATERDHIIAAIDFLEQWSKIEAPASEGFMLIEQLLSSNDIESHRLLAEWKYCLDLLAAYDVSSSSISLRPGLARDWEYYTGIVFELYTQDQVHLAGGGRYDGLTRLVGGSKDIPAVGFVYYIDQLLSLIARLNPSPPGNALVIGFETGAEYAASQWAYQLRQAGFDMKLLPLDQLNDDAPAIIVDKTNHAQLAEQTYALTNIASVIENLKRA
jgi:histidyl-tRNA synthetase